MTDTLAQDIVEGRIKPLTREQVLMVTTPERHRDTVQRLRSKDWMAKATTTVVTLRPREIPFGEDPIAPDAHTFGG